MAAFSPVVRYIPDEKSYRLHTNLQICRHSRVGGNLKARYISIQPRNCITIASRAGNDADIKVIEKNVSTR